MLLSASPGVEVLVNTTTAGVQRTHVEGGRSIDAAADDSYVVVWSSTVGDGSGWGVFARQFDSTGTPTSGEIAVNTFTAGDQNNAAVAVRDDGSFVVVWQSRLQDGSGQGVYAREFDATGTPVTAEIPVSVTTAGNQQMPAIALRAGGGYAIAWSGKGPGDPNGTYARVFADGGAALTGEIAVNDTKEFAQVHATVAADDSGGFAVAWHGNGGSDRKNVMFRHFDGAGAPLSAEVVVNETTAGIQKTPSIAWSDGGHFVVAWSGKGAGDDDGIFARRIDGAGTPLGSEILVNETVPAKQTEPSVTTTPGGGFFVAWAHDAGGGDFDIVAREFDSTDTPLSGDAVINSTLLGIQRSPTAVAVTGGARVAWSGPGIGDKFGVFDPVVVLSGESLVNTTTAGQQRTHVEGGRAIGAAADDSYVVVWSSTVGDGSGWGVFARLFDATGTPTSGEIAVNTFTAGDQNNAAVAVRADGSFIVVWQSKLQDGSGQGTYAREFDATGTPVTAEIPVTVTTAGNQQMPVITVLAGGGYAIAWSGKGPGDPNGTYARVFADGGAPVTGEIAVNETKDFAQVYATIAADATGGFAVAWHGNGGSDRKNIMFRHFDGAGAPLSAEVVVNETLAGIQKTPSIAWSSAGHFIVAWSGKGTGDDSGIFARRIDGAGVPLGSEILVNETLPGVQTNPSIAAIHGGGFVVTWAHDAGGGDFDIMAREIDGTDTPVTSDTIINTTIPGRQWNPSIVAVTDAVRIVWSGPGEGDFFGVFESSASVSECDEDDEEGEDPEPLGIFTPPTPEDDGEDDDECEDDDDGEDGDD